MILTKKDLNTYLRLDLERFKSDYKGKPTIIDLILKNEWTYIYRYIWLLRHVEYHKNTNHRLRHLLFFCLFKRIGFKLNFTIYPNTIGPGFRIYHRGGFTHIKKNSSIGRNFSALPGLVIGNKNFPKSDNTKVIIGDNVSIGLNVVILGEVHIGNNVSIGANSVITRDIPDDAVVAGIPAKIIKFI